MPWGKSRRQTYEERRGIFISRLSSFIDDEARPDRCNIIVAKNNYRNEKTGKLDPNLIIIEITPNMEDQEEIDQHEAISKYRKESKNAIDAELER